MQHFLTLDDEWLRARFQTNREEFDGIKVAADRVGKSYSTVHRWVGSREIRALRVGGTLWVYLPSLDTKFYDAADSDHRCEHRKCS